MRFQLVAEIVDEDLFRKAIHEAGTIFYRKLENGEYELVYFSGSRNTAISWFVRESGYQSS